MRTSCVRTLFCALLALAVLSETVELNAQVAGATISGMITDSTGKVIPNVALAGNIPGKVFFAGVQS